MSSVITKTRSALALQCMGVDTQRLSLPMYCRRNTQREKAQSRDLTTEAKKQMLKSWLEITSSSESNWRCNKASAVCAVWRSNRGFIFVSIATICPTTNMSTSHSIKTTLMTMGLLSTIFTAKWLSWCCSLEECVLQFATFSTFPSGPFDETDIVDCTPHLHRVVHSSRCPYVPTICAAIVVYLRSRCVFLISDSFSNTSATMISHHCPMQLEVHCQRGDARLPAEHRAFNAHVSWFDRVCLAPHVSYFFNFLQAACSLTFYSAHSAIYYSFCFLEICVQASGHVLSGLVVFWIFESLPFTHLYPSRSHVRRV